MFRTNEAFSAILDQYRDQILKSAELRTTYNFSPSDRSVFSLENIDEVIKYLMPKDTPLRNRFPRVTGKGERASWNMITGALNAKTGGTGTSAFFADAGTPNETTQSTTPASQLYKLLGRKLEVGILANTASEGRASSGNMFDERMRIKAVEVMQCEEEALIMGDSAFSALEFDGLLKQITTTSGTSGSLLSVSGLQSQIQTIWEKGASPTLVVAHAVQLKALANQLEKAGAIQRIQIVDQSGVTAGQKLSKIINSIDGSAIDIIPSRYVGDNALVLTERSSAGEVYIQVDDLIPMSKIAVPSSSLSLINFIFEAMCLKVIGEVFQAKITGLSIT